MITAVLPISRTVYLKRVLDALLSQTVRPDNTIVIYDGDDIGARVANGLVSSVPGCIFMRSNNRKVGLNISDRRRNISNNHNQFKGLIGDCDWVFSVEDDSIIPNDALEKLLATARSRQNVGMVTGVELGRWGAPYVGAWSVDDPMNVKKIQSLPNKTKENVGVEEIDACGLYCALIRADKYKENNFHAYNGLGPDVNLGIFLRKNGFKNYIDWSIHVTHLTSLSGIEVEIPATDTSVVLSLTHIHGNVWQLGG